MKFTFKTTKATGKFRSFQKDAHVIKLDKREVGSISDDPPHHIKFSIIKKDINSDGNPNCIWEWITLTRISESIEDAKLWVNENIIKITGKYNLYKFEK